MAVQRLEVAQRLGLRQRAECIRLFWNRQIRLHGIDQLQKQPVVGATLVQLPCGVQIARAVPGRGGYVMSDHDGLAQGAQCGINFRAWSRVGENRHISMRRRLLKQLRKGLPGGGIGSAGSRP